MLDQRASSLLKCFIGYYKTKAHEWLGLWRTVWPNALILNLYRDFSRADGSFRSSEWEYTLYYSSQTQEL